MACHLQYHSMYIGKLEISQSVDSEGTRFNYDRGFSMNGGYD